MTESDVCSIQYKAIESGDKNKAKQNENAMELELSEGFSPKKENDKVEAVEEEVENEWIDKIPEQQTAGLFSFNNFDDGDTLGNLLTSSLRKDERVTLHGYKYLEEVVTLKIACHRPCTPHQILTSNIDHLLKQCKSLQLQIL